jgi:Ni/Co efflux regulator RcnB
MKTLSRMFVALALLAGTGAASADPWHDQNRGRGHDDRGHDRGYDDHRGHDRDGWRGRDNRDHWDHRYYSDRSYYGRPHWQRGYRYDGPMYIVNDYRGYRLAPPPYGYRWVRNDGNFLLVSIGDGVILDIR